MNFARFSLPSLLLLLFAACQGASLDLGTTEEKIIGGSAGNTSEFPTIVALSVGGGLCTGTLISPTLVLTAAHCITPSLLGLGSQEQLTAQIRVLLDAQSLAGGVAVQVTETIPHPSFSTSSLGDNDIGLIRLATPVTDREPTPINRIAADAPIGISLTQVGYGATQVGGGGAGTLQVLRDKLTTSCSTFGVSDANLLCFSQVDGTGKCVGDSGGPSYATIDGVVRVVGVTSFGDQTCAQFGADTRVDAELEFLYQNAPELQCQADGQCNEDCGVGPLPADDDCDLCTEDSECGNDSICDKDGQCVAAPFSPGGEGSECTGNDACDSQLCAMGEDVGICTSVCESSDSCLDGFQCIEASGTNVCWPTQSDGGCNTGNRGRTPPAGVVLMLFAVLLGLRLRRKAIRIEE